MGYKKRPPTHDELGEALIKEWDGNVAFFYGAWHLYEFGVWRRTTLSLDFWQVQIKFKKDGVEPTSGRCTSIEAYCRARLTVDESELHGGDNYVNLQNGLYNLHERSFEPDHQRELYLTHQLPFHYDRLADCSLFEAWIEQVLVTPDGKPDLELRRLVQEAFSYSMTTDTHFRASFWVVGPKGSGKSTLVNILIALSGDMHTPIALEDINNPYTLAKLAGKRLATFSEPDNRTPLNDAVFKKLVSKDHVPARQIYGMPFDFVPVCKLWGSMNDLPRVTDRSGAAFDRMIIIPFHRAIPKEKRDLRLEDKLMEELPGIFNWAMGGAGRLNHQGHFTTVQQSDDAIEEYQRDNDVEYQLTQELQQTPGQFTMFTEINNFYRGWCLENGYSAKSSANFRRELIRLGYKCIRRATGWIVEGLSLKKRGIF